MFKKVCIKCGKEKTLNSFSKRSNKCKLCHIKDKREYARSWRRANREANPEKVKAKNKELRDKYYRANPEKFKARRKEYMKAYREANPEEQAERGRKQNIRHWVKRYMKKRGITEKDAIKQYKVMQAFRAATRQSTETSHELMTLGIF